MTSIDLSNTVVVFDLDDTIYSENDYFLSGVNEILMTISLIYGDLAASKLLNYDFERNREKFLQDIVSILDLPLITMESLLWIYRLHTPKIALSQSVAGVISKLELCCKNLVILTDGRSISQRQKIKALNLDHLPLYISEEYSSEKPDSLRYLKIMQDFPSSSYVYVGDNPAKDFMAPNVLNWGTIGLKGSINNIHSQKTDHFSAEYHPKKWINNLDEVFYALCE